jgi:hypothetical protein
MSAVKAKPNATSILWLMELRESVIGEFVFHQSCVSDLVEGPTERVRKSYEKRGYIFDPIIGRD